MIAPPNANPALTNPNTLPIWPGGAASLTITSRGVRLAPMNRPVANSTPTIATCGIAARLTHSISADPATVSASHEAEVRSVQVGHPARR